MLVPQLQVVEKTAGNIKAPAVVKYWQPALRCGVRGARTRGHVRTCYVIPALTVAFAAPVTNMTAAPTVIPTTTVPIATQMVHGTLSFGYRTCPPRGTGRNCGGFSRSQSLFLATHVRHGTRLGGSSGCCGIRATRSSLWSAWSPHPWSHRHSCYRYRVRDSCTSRCIHGFSHPSSSLLLSLWSRNSPLPVASTRLLTLVVCATPVATMTAAPTVSLLRQCRLPPPRDC